MKLSGCRAAMYPFHIQSAYSDTAAVMSFSRRGQYVKSWIATNWQSSLCPYLELYCTHSINH